MTFSLPDSFDVLRRTPSILTALLGGLGDSWVRGNYGEKTFSPFDVVGHLIHADRTNWITRLQWILAEGERRPFPEFDRYAMYETDAGKSVDELLQTFTQVRAASVATVESLKLTPEMLERRGTHPAFGSVTLQQLLATWVVHDLGHLHQIAKAMAFQYRGAVGPWQQYLTILPASPP